MFPGNTRPIDQNDTIDRKNSSAQTKLETRRERRTRMDANAVSMPVIETTLPGPRRLRRAAERSICPGPVADLGFEPMDLTSSHLRVVRSQASQTISPLKQISRRPTRRRGATLLSISAVLAVGMIIVATSMPADALASVQEANGPLRSETIPSSELAIQTQSLVNNASNEAPFSRDSYSAGITALEKRNSYVDDSVASQASGKIQWPFAPGAYIGSNFGPRAGCSIGCSTNHLGQDFTPGYGTPIRAVADGVVVQSSDYAGGFGVKIVIEHRINGRTVRSLYAHMKRGSRQVQIGTPVTAGQIIAQVGNSGISTGPHLHLEILLDGKRNVDPLGWLYANAS